MTDQIPTGSIYRDVPWFGSGVRGLIEKREMTLTVQSVDGGVAVKSVPIFDRDDILRINRESDKFPYIDLGCVVVAIKALHNPKAGVRGKALLVDRMWDNVNQAKIAGFKFDLSKDGFAAFAVFPGYSISSKGDFTRRLEMIVNFENLNLAKGVDHEPVAISIGVIARVSPTAFPIRNESISGSKECFQSIIGSEYLQLEGLEEKVTDLADSFNIQRNYDCKVEKVEMKERKAWMKRLPSTKIVTAEVLSDESDVEADVTVVRNPVLDRANSMIHNSYRNINDELEPSSFAPARRSVSDF